MGQPGNDEAKAESFPGFVFSGGDARGLIAFQINQFEQHPCNF
jgi:hypothetical protein